MRVRKLHRVDLDGSSSSVLEGVLQCAVVCCSVLQCVAVCCSVLQCVAANVYHIDFDGSSSSVQANPLQHTAIHCNTLQTHCNTLQTHCNTLQHTATHCNTSWWLFLLGARSSLGLYLPRSIRRPHGLCILKRSPLSCVKETYIICKRDIYHMLKRRISYVRPMDSLQHTHSTLQHTATAYLHDICVQAIQRPPYILFRRISNIEPSGDERRGTPALCSLK